MHACCLDSLNGTQVSYTESDAVLLLTPNAKTQRQCCLALVCV